MKFIIKTGVILILIISFASTASQATDGTWNQITTISGSGMNTAYDVAVDSQGNTITAGTFTETLNLGGEQLSSFGNLSILLAKHDPDGNLIWIKRFGSTGYDYGYSVAIDQDDQIYLAGAFSNIADFAGNEYTAQGQRDAFIARVSSDGRVSWVEHLKSEGRDAIRDISLTPEGDILIAGRFSDELNLPGATLNARRDDDGFVARMTPEQEITWAHRFSSRGDASISALTASDEALYVGTRFQGDLEIGSITHPSRGNHDLALTKMNFDGEIDWSIHMDGYGSDNISGIEITPDGDILMTGHFNNDIVFGREAIESEGRDNMYLTSFDDADGSVNWIRYGTSDYWNYGRGILALDDGIVLAGYFYKELTIADETIDFGVETYSGLTIFLDYDGTVTDYHIIGGDRSDFVQGVTADPNDNFYIFGRYYGDFHAGDRKVTSQSSSDIFLARYGDAEPYTDPMTAGYELESTEDSLYVTYNLTNVADLFYMSFEVSYRDDHVNFERIEPGSIMGDDVVHMTSETELGTGISIGRTNQSAAYEDGELLTMVFSAGEQQKDINGTINFHKHQAETPSGRSITVQYPESAEFRFETPFMVWPGDVNNDGVVDERDVLELARHIGKSGEARDNQNIAWDETTTTPWDDTLATFADTDGNGIVDHNDLKAIVYNFGQERSASNQKRMLAEAPSDAAGQSIPALRANETEQFTISASDLEANISGASAQFRINGIDEQTYSIESVEPGGWFANHRDDSDLLHFNYSQGDVAAIAIAYPGSGTYLDIDADELFTITVKATRDWTEEASLSIASVSVSNGAGNQQLSEIETTGSERNADPETPSQTELVGNYPNPFNPTTEINYNVSEDAQVSLEVYDLLGNRVATLVDHQQSAGSYGITFSGNDLSSGTYIYRLAAGGVSETKTMTLVK